MDKDISLLTLHEGGDDVLVDNDGSGGEANQEGHKEEKGELHCGRKKEKRRKNEKNEKKKRKKMKKK